MASYSIGEAINLLLEKRGWKPKVNELKLNEEWEQIMGKTIAKYTKGIHLNNQVLTIYTDMAALKQELLFGKEQIISNINQHFQERIVNDVIVR